MADDQMLVERVFTVELPPDRSWQTLADLDAWPTWAPHIRSVSLSPPGPLGPASRGRFHFSPVGTGDFEMVAWDPPRAWTWTGRALGVPIRYVHVFEPVGAHRTELRWRVELSRGRRGLRARLLAAVYARLIDRAWPRFRDQANATHTP
jgi:Polyketide cyclase / dehydrase and lipid transport